jgi:tetratricopeptide (TPR) repeat protein
MSAEEQQIESLHQKASAQYLQGDFKSALDTWCQLLAVSPGDERAHEGVRLCEMLSESEGGESAGRPTANTPAAPQETETTPADAPGTPAAAAPPALDVGLGVDMEQLDLSLEIGELEPPQTPVDTPPASSTASHELPDPSRQDEGIDFGDVAAADSFALAIDIPRDEPTRAAHAGGPAPSALSDTAAGPDPAETAAAELATRTAELLAEARAAYDRREIEETLRILSRVLILDEENSEALALQAKIEAEFTAPAAQAPTEDLLGDLPDEVGDPFEHALENLNLDGGATKTEVPLHGGPTPDLPPEGAEVHEIPTEALIPATQDSIPAAPVETPLAAPEAGGAADEFGEDSENDLVVEDDIGLEAVPVELSAKRAKKSLGIPLWAIAALGLVILAGGAAWLFLPFGADPAVAIAADSETPGPSTAAPTTAGDGPTPPAATAVATAEPAATPKAESLSPDEIRGLLADAGDAFERGDYSAAVVVYSRILRAHPGHGEAKDGLQLAGERYRAKKEIEDKWQQAIQSFNEGDYRSALTVLYRMPASEDQARLARFKRNGWYNMGLQALGVSDCGSARTHFKEAKSVDPTDEAVLLGIDLADACRNGERDRAYHSAVQQLPLRALDD